ncbi:hypothetical protein OIU79_023116 [Salix purpurea]|uniref:Uncharacterized protein n=1 Tax=Salix purpurea TaxID=77065 RepID=A0A9Q0WIW0_SALPP|nr:hypothetical protein OIU79_023116 [Salix purpurea]
MLGDFAQWWKLGDIGGVCYSRSTTTNGTWNHETSPMKIKKRALLLLFFLLMLTMRGTATCKNQQNIYNVLVPSFFSDHHLFLSTVFFSIP